MIEGLLHAKRCDATKLRVFWWLFFVIFWCGYTFVRYEEEKEGYKNEFTSCLHAHACVVLCLAWDHHGVVFSDSS